MKLGQSKAGVSSAAVSSADNGDRRLIGGLVVSLLLHALVLLLQFGVPGLGLPGAPPPLTVRIAAVAPPAPPLPAPLPEPDSPIPPPSPAPLRPTSGMQMIDPVVTPAAPLPKATPLVKKGKPRRARRISTPLPAQETEAEMTRVIAQDSKLNDFSVPVARPEEAETKTVDITEAQHGEDDGDAGDSAALEAAAAKAGKLKAEEEAQAQKLAEEKREAGKRAAEQAALLAEQKKADEALRNAEQAAQLQKAEQDAARDKEQQLAQQNAEQLKLALQKIEQQRAEQQKVEQQRVEQQRAEQLRAEQLKAEQLKAEQQKTEQLKLEQRRVEQQVAERQRAEQLKAEQAALEQQRAEQKRVEQQKAEQQRLEQQKAEQQRLAEQKAEQQRAEQQKAEQQKAEQQKAEQQRAEQQRAEQQRAAQQRAEREAAQRGRELVATQPGSTGQGGPAAGTGIVGGTNKIPQDMLGSDLGNRARDLVKGLDVLRGAPPGVRRTGDRRAVVSFNERDLPLKMYVESWRQKIERNGALNYPRSWADAVRIDPLVSVAVRSDGTVEDVIIVSSSGRADMDEAVRRIVRVNARYSPFPQQIAERYDVIEIRRVWRFDDALKLMEELH